VSGPAAAVPVPALVARDRFMQGLGMELVAGGEGHAALRLRVTEQHLNFLGYCHGGVIFALADAALGLASNAHGEIAVALDAHVAYTTAARLGDELSAVASQLNRSRRMGTYRVEVRNAAGALVAHFTGTVYRTDKPVPTELP
jgi:acyl-CoA thioesterase